MSETPRQPPDSQNAPPQVAALSAAGSALPLTQAPDSATTAQDVLPEWAPPPPQPPPALSGEPHLPQVPGYEMLAILGKGGMGVVYKARQIALKRLVALKMIRHGEYADEESKQRFRREYEAVARLRHPNIVQIFEVGEFQGQPYFALEYCDSGTLRNKLKDGPLPVIDAAGIIETLARAMDLAHQNLIIHRDLKPENILIGHRPASSSDSNKDHSGSGSKSDSQWSLSLKITDFGLAKKMDGDEIATRVELTETGAVMGTVGYMAPEQARGDRVGPLADVYALGAILYELLTGQPPFGGSPIAKLTKVLHHEPEPPRRYRADIPRDLDTICLKCLQKEPAARYASAEALAEDLRRFLAGEPIVARPVNGLERVYKWARRYPARATALTLGLLVLLFAGVGASMWLLWQDAETAKRETSQINKELQSKNQEYEKLNVSLENLNKTLKSKGEEIERLNDELKRFMYFDRVLLAGKMLQAGQTHRAKELLDLCKKDSPEHLNLEWHYLQNRLAPEIAVPLTGHLAKVRQVVYSPDGERLASVSDNGTIKLWDLKKAKAIATLTGHKGQVWQVAISPNNRWLASAGVDHTIKLWDAHTGKTLHTLEGHKGEVRHIAFSPDGNQLASASTDKTVKLWDPATGKESFTLTGHQAEVWHLAYSPDTKSHLLASASKDKTIGLWDTQTGQEKATLRGHTGYAWHVAFSPDGTRLASAAGADVRHLIKGAGVMQPAVPDSAKDKSPPISNAVDTQDNVIKIWEVARAREMMMLSGHREWIYHVAFSPDGQQLASASGDGTVKLWDMASGQSVATLSSQTNDSQIPCYSPDGLRLVSANGSAVSFWDTRTGDQVRSLEGGDDAFTCVAHSPDGHQLAAATADGLVKLWDIRTHKAVAALTSHDGAVNVVAFSPDGQFLASASADGTAVLCDARTGKELCKLTKHTGAVTHLAFSSDSKQLATASLDWTVKLWDVPTGQLMKGMEQPRKEDHSNLVRHLAYNPHGPELASASADGAIKLWDMRTGKALALALAAPKAKDQHGTERQLGFTFVAYSPDGQQLAGAVADGTIILWHPDTGVKITLQGHQDGVNVVAYQKNGNFLASASADNTIMLWNVKTGQRQAVLKNHRKGVQHVTFSPDGQRIASASLDGTVKLWDVNKGEEVVTLQAAHKGGVNHVAYSPDGKRLASCGSDGTVRLWDALTGQEVATLEGHKGSVLCLAFHPDSQLLASACADKTVRLWYGKIEAADWQRRVGK
ncbi:MAG TPA: protein kinase [Gemmataceae bacterium]|nr:protein kinase [Gemmataceae bacterium]